MTKRRFSARATARFAVPALLAAVLSSAPACRRTRPVQVQETTDEEGPRMASIVHTGDPRSDAQLISGFYGIEQNSWRWTAQRFSVVLRPPAGAAQRGATLVVSLTVPDVVITKLHTISLTASIGGNTLPPETYTQPGPYTFKRDVAPNLLTNATVQVDFQLDKVMQPDGGDIRQLGVVVNSIGLEPR